MKAEVSEDKVSGDGGQWRGGSNYTTLYQLQIHFIFNFNFNYNYTHNFSNQSQLHHFNYIMRNQIYSAFVNYIFLPTLLNFNILYTTYKQI